MQSKSSVQIFILRQYGSLHKVYSVSYELGFWLGLHKYCITCSMPTCKIGAGTFVAERVFL